MLKLPLCALMSMLLLTLASALPAAETPSTLVANLSAGKKQTLVVFGTSLTSHGAWVGKLNEVLDKKFPGLLTLANGAESGMQSTWGLQNVKQRVIAKKPDTVLIEFGINDAHKKFNISTDDARKNLEGMIDAILKSNPACEVILMTMNPAVGQNSENRNHKENDYFQVYRDVAKERKLRLIDHYANWKAIIDKNEKDFLKLAPDGLHPGAEGAEKVILPELLKSLGVK